MADVRCSICAEREVGVVDIIHVGYGDRYQVCSIASSLVNSPYVVFFKRNYKSDFLYVVKCADPGDLYFWVYRVQLECMKCGNTWYSSRDAISSLVIKTNEAPPNVGVAPWATSKFDEVERDLQAGHTADADQVPATASTETKPLTDTKGSASPHHYEDVENTLQEHLSVTNPVAETFVNIDAQPAAAAELKQTPSPKIASESDAENGKPTPPPAEVSTDHRTELEKPHVDGITGSFLPENPAPNGTSHSGDHKA